MNENEMREKALITLYMNRGQWVSSKKLAVEAGYDLRGTRVELRKAIRKANFLGAPVLTGAKGFMWAVHPNQLAKYRERLNSRAGEILARSDALKRCEEKMRAVWNEKEYENNLIAGLKQ